MLFKIISYRKFRALQEEQRKLKDQCAELEAEISKYQQQEDHLNQELHKKDELLEEQLINLKKMGQLKQCYMLFLNFHVKKIYKKLK